MHTGEIEEEEALLYARVPDKSYGHKGIPPRTAIFQGDNLFNADRLPGTRSSPSSESDEYYGTSDLKPGPPFSPFP